MIIKLSNNKFDKIYTTWRKIMKKLLVMMIFMILNINVVVASDYIIHENKLLTKLGFSIDMLINIFENKTEFSQNNDNISIITSILPSYLYRKYKSYNLQQGAENTINVIYSYDESFYNYDHDSDFQKIEQQDPFRDTILENNALLLFLSIKGLHRVNFRYEGEEDYCNTYLVNEMGNRFGNVYYLKFENLYNALVSNIQLSEYYFAHDDRACLGSDYNYVFVHAGWPDEFKILDDGSTVYIAKEIGKMHEITPEGMLIIHKGHEGYFYFDSPIAIRNDNLTRLYAKKYEVIEDKSYDDIINHFGYPTVEEVMEDGKKFIAYLLRCPKNRYAYFILDEDKVIFEGTMYGCDYKILR